MLVSESVSEFDVKINTTMFQVYYRNDTTHEPYPIEIEGCPRPCSLSKFSVRNEPHIPTDWIKECEVDLCNENPLKGGDGEY